MTDRKGFTLLEILIALAIAAVLLAAVYGTFFMVQKATDRAGGSLGRLYECRKAMDIIRGELISAKSPITVVGKEYLGKKGSTLAFVTYAPRTGLLTATTYYVREKDGKLSLMKEITEPGRPTISAVILDNIDGFLAEVYSGGQWTDSGSYTASPGTAANSVEGTIRISLSMDFKGTPLKLTEYATPLIGTQL